MVPVVEVKEAEAVLQDVCLSNLRSDFAHFLLHTFIHTMKFVLQLIGDIKINIPEQMLDIPVFMPAVF